MQPLPVTVSSRISTAKEISLDDASLSPDAVVNQRKTSLSGDTEAIPADMTQTVSIDNSSRRNSLVENETTSMSPTISPVGSTILDDSDSDTEEIDPTSDLAVIITNTNDMTTIDSSDEPSHDSDYVITARIVRRKRLINILSDQDTDEASEEVVNNINDKGIQVNLIESAASTPIVVTKPAVTTMDKQVQVYLILIQIIYMQ
jgi:hypothetical protein